MTAIDAPQGKLAALLVTKLHVLLYYKTTNDSNHPFGQLLVKGLMRFQASRTTTNTSLISPCITITIYMKTIMFSDLYTYIDFVSNFKISLQKLKKTLSFTWNQPFQKAVSYQRLYL